MNAFDKVIGYKATKRELLQLCDGVMLDMKAIDDDFIVSSPVRPIARCLII